MSKPTPPKPRRPNHAAPSRNITLVGPSGGGKTRLVEALLLHGRLDRAPTSWRHQRGAVAKLARQLS